MLGCELSGVFFLFDIAAHEDSVAHADNGLEYDPHTATELLTGMSTDLVKMSSALIARGATFFNSSAL